MLTKEDLYKQNTMAGWSDISLELYKAFTTECLFPKIFKYYLENGKIIEVQFKEWAMCHLWGIHHIDGKIGKNNLFTEIDNGLCFSDFFDDPTTKKRLMDNKDRIRMFVCIYSILKNGDTFFVKDGILSGTKIKVNYIRSRIINGKGVNVGMRLEEGVYVPLTILIDRAINPTATVDGLEEVKVKKLEIIEDEKVIETVNYEGDVLREEYDFSNARKNPYVKKGVKKR